MNSITEQSHADQIRQQIRVLGKLADSFYQRGHDLRVASTREEMNYHSCIKKIENLQNYLERRERAVRKLHQNYPELKERAVRKTNQK